MVQDQELFAKIGELVEEEKRLLNERDLDQDQQRKLDSLGVQLDQCWDLLRQRRGARHAGTNPADARVRDPATVEHYQQ
ncbi:MAG TPA: DUF2630 family protein [Dehalococcoidia bacterium]|jgi:hypothetical protein